MSVIQEVIAKAKEKDPSQPEFHQAVEAVLTTLAPTVEKHPEFVKAKIYERVVEPDIDGPAKAANAGPPGWRCPRTACALPGPVKRLINASTGS